MNDKTGQSPPPSSLETWNYGSPAELFMEYVRRSEPFTMEYDHFHSYYEVYYLLSGSRIYFVKDRSYRVEQGDLVFIPRNELHKTLQTSEPGHERAVIHFSDAFLKKVAAGHEELLLSPFRQKTPVIRLPLAEQRIVDNALRRALSEIRRKPAGYELIPGAAVTELLLATARYLLHYEPVPVSDPSPLQAKISEVVRYLNDHYGEALKLGDVAERFFISPYYLSRMFKETTGFTFSDYITLTRIKEAQRLLRETDNSVSEIAASVGFDNFSHFGKTFKKIARLSPREYRNSSV